MPCFTLVLKSVDKSSIPHVNTPTAQVKFLYEFALYEVLRLNINCIRFNPAYASWTVDKHIEDFKISHLLNVFVILSWLHFGISFNPFIVLRLLTKLLKSIPFTRGRYNHGLSTYIRVPILSHHGHVF